jgi:hypothetical protein
MPSTKHVRFVATLLTGVALGAALTAAYLRQPREVAKEPSKEATKEVSKRPRLNLKVFHPDPSGWLFPPDFHIEGIIPDAADLQALQTPDRVTLYQRCKADVPGAIQIAGFHFSPQGTEVSGDDRTKLLDLTRSISAYGPPSMCMFDPGVLMHCERSGYVLDLLFCFSCDDVYALRGQKHERAFGAGISDIGRRLFLQHFTRALPKYTELKDLYQAYELPAAPPIVRLR